VPFPGVRRRWLTRLPLARHGLARVDRSATLTSDPGARSAAAIARRVTRIPDVDHRHQPQHLGQLPDQLRRHHVTVDLTGLIPIEQAPDGRDHREPRLHRRQPVLTGPQHQFDEAVRHPLRPRPPITRASTRAARSANTRSRATTACRIRIPSTSTATGAPPTR
jgi:hypothetical protein